METTENNFLIPSAIQKLHNMNKKCGNLGRNSAENRIASITRRSIGQRKRRLYNFIISCADDKIESL